jgi:hypothetical protein
LQIKNKVEIIFFHPTIASTLFFSSPSALSAQPPLFLLSGIG